MAAFNASKESTPSATPYPLLPGAGFFDAVAAPPAYAGTTVVSATSVNVDTPIAKILE